MASRVCWGSSKTLQPPGVTMHRPPALHSHPEGSRHLLTAHLPDLPDRLRAVLALWVEATLLGLNGCQDTVILALEPLVLALDPTSKQDKLVALVNSVVYRQHAHPGGPV